MDVQVVPALVVFHTPPDPTATYHVCGWVGWIAISAIRPEAKAGPIDRHLKALRFDSERSDLSLSWLYDILATRQIDTSKSSFLIGLILFVYSECTVFR